MAARFNPAPGWPPIPDGWTPPPGWAPDPNWPPAPPGWQFWVDDVAPAATAPPPPTADSGSPTGQTPASVPYAEYAHQGGTQQLYPQGQGVEPGKKNHLVWIIPVAVVVVLGLVFGGLAIAGVLSSDEDGKVAATASPTPSDEPVSPEPTEPGVEPSPDVTTDGLDGLDGLEGLEGLEELLGGEKSDDPAVPAFCQSFLALDDDMPETAEGFEEYLRGIERLTPPDELAGDWGYVVGMFRESADRAKALDGTETPEEIEQLMDFGFLQDEKAMEALGRFGIFMSVNCDAL